MKVNFYTIVSMISVDATKVHPVLRSTRRMRKCAGWLEMRLARQGEEKSAIVAAIRKLEKQEELKHEVETNAACSEANQDENGRSERRGLGRSC